MVIKIVTYAIIYFVVSKLGKKINKANQERVVPAECIDYFDMKVQSVIIFCCAVIFTVITIIAVCIPGNDPAKNVAMTIFFIISILGYAFSFMLSQWYIAIKRDVLETGSYLGKKQVISFDEITSAERDGRDNVHLYIKEKQVFTFDRQFDKKKLLKVLNENHIVTTYQYSINDFVIKKTKFTLYSGIVMTVGSMVFMYMSLFLNFMLCAIGLITGLVTLLLSLNSVFGGMYNRTVIKDGMICQYKLFNKTREMAFSEIKKLERNKENEIEYVYLYAEGKKEICICMNDVNANLFEEITKLFKSGGLC